MDVKEKALLFAIMAHRGQVRKNEPEKPLIIHPIGVGHLLESYGYDDNVIAAGYLHDVVEDTKYTLEDIRSRFGDDIASLVDVASEPDKSLSWEERKQHTINVVKKLPLRKKLVICADKINNIEDLSINFTKTGQRDFSKFNRGEESQKWYYENIYDSLIFGEDEQLPIFKRLKENIDTVFNPINNEFLESIFVDNHNYYEKLKKIDALKQELTRLKDICNLSRPLVIEFSGTPRTGKTTVINDLYDFFKKGGFDVKLISELTTSEYYKQSFFKTIENLPKYQLNLEVFKETRRQLEDAINSKSDIVIIDRSLCDRLIWMYRLVYKKTIDMDVFEKFINENISYIQSFIDVLVVTYTDSITSLKRDYMNSLALEKRCFLNIDNIEEYNQSLLNCEKLFKENTNYIRVDTTELSIRDSSVLVAEEVMNKIKKLYLEELNKKYK